MKWFNKFSSFILLFGGAFLFASESTSTFADAFRPRTGGVAFTPGGVRTLSSRRTSMSDSLIKVIADLPESEIKRADRLFSGNAANVEDDFGFQEDRLLVQFCAYGIQHYRDQAHASHMSAFIRMLIEALNNLPTNSDIKDKAGEVTIWLNHLLEIASPDEIKDSMSEELFNSLKNLFERFEGFISAHTPHADEEHPRVSSRIPTRRALQRAASSFSAVGMPQASAGSVDPEKKKATSEKAEALQAGLTGTVSNENSSLRPSDEKKANIKARASLLNLPIRGAAAVSATSEKLSADLVRSHSVGNHVSSATSSTSAAAPHDSVASSANTPRYMHGDGSPERPSVLPPPMAIDPTTFIDLKNVHLPPPPPPVANPLAFAFSPTERATSAPPLTMPEPPRVSDTTHSSVSSAATGPAAGAVPSFAAPLTASDAPRVPDTTYRAPVPPMATAPVAPAGHSSGSKADKKDAGVTLTKIIIASGAMGIGAWLFKVYFWDNPAYAQNDIKKSVKV